MIEIKNDFLAECRTNKYDAICVTTNTTLDGQGRLVMGAGIAKEILRDFPSLPRIWGEKLKAQQYEHPMLFVETLTYPHVVAFPTKRNWKDKSPLELVVASARQLRYMADCLGWGYILLPRPDCSNGGLAWGEVKAAISFLDDRFYLISNAE